MHVPGASLNPLSTRSCQVQAEHLRSALVGTCEFDCEEPLAVHLSSSSVQSSLGVILQLNQFKREHDKAPRQAPGNSLVFHIRLTVSNPKQKTMHSFLRLSLLSLATSSFFLTVQASGHGPNQLNHRRKNVAFASNSSLEARDTNSGIFTWYVATNLQF